LDQQAEQQIDKLAATRAGDDPGGEDYLTKLGRLRMARFTAETQVVAECLRRRRTRRPCRESR